MFDRVLNMPLILNMPAFLIYRDSQYTRVVNMRSEYTADFEYVKVLDITQF